MSIKKSILSASALALALSVVVSGTLAYQNSQSPTQVNVMTAGDVELVQSEWERAVDDKGNWITSEYTGYGYTADLMQPFTQGKEIAPAVYKDGKVKWDDRNGNQNPSGEGSHQQPWSQIGAPGSNQLFDDSVKNVIDKFVFVENTGSKDAYYRTVIAIEAPVGFNNDLIHVNKNGNSRFEWSDWENITVDGVQYIMTVATHTEVLESGEYSRPSLLQLYLDPKTTDEQIKLLGDTWEVLVMSQANQTDGFGSAEDSLNSAFGEINATNHPWIDYKVSEDVNADNAEDALTEDKSTIIVNLTEDITYDVAAWAANGMGGESTKNIIINGNGHKITFNQTNSDWNNIATTNDAVLTINDAHITNSGYNNGPWNRHDINFDCPVVLNDVTSDKAIALKDAGTFNNVTISDDNTSDTYALWIQPNGQTVTLDGCTIDMIGCTDGRGIKIDEQYVANPAKVTLNVSDTTFKTEEKSAILVKSVAGADINIDNIDITNVAADITNAVWVDEASSAYFDLVTVTGGSKIQE